VASDRLGVDADKDIHMNRLSPAIAVLPTSVHFEEDPGGGSGTSSKA